MKIFASLFIFLITVFGAFAAGNVPVSKAISPEVPYGAASSDSIHIVWNSVKSIDSEICDYFVYVNGKKLSVSAAEQAKNTNHYASSFKKSFYSYFNEERTDLKMVQTDTTFYRIENLKPNKSYNVQICAVDKNQNEKLISEAITVKTAKKPSKILNITKFGASVDSKNNAKAIQTAIDKCPEGGVVYIPEGTFVSGSIHLKSNMTLKIDGELKGSPDAKDYDFGFLMYPYYTDKRYFGLINSDGAKNIRICGRGIVNGNGWKYYDASTGWEIDTPQFYAESGDPNFEKSTYSEDLKLPIFIHGSRGSIEDEGILAWSCFTESGLENSGEAYATRSTTLILRHTDGIFIEGLTFTNPANHMINIIDSKNVSVTGITELTYDVNNGDGLGFICTENGFVWNNFIDTGDDSIVFSAGVGASAAESGESGAGNFRIFGNYIHHGHGGVAFGSHTALGIHDVIVEDIIFSHTDAPFRFKSAPANGGEVYNITFRNSAIAESQQTITMSTNYSDKGTVSKYGAADKIAVFHHIKVENITAFGFSRNGIAITAKDGDNHNNISISDVSISGAGREGTPGNPGAWFALKNVKDSSFKNIKVLSWDKSSEEDSRVMWGLKEGLENVIFE